MKKYVIENLVLSGASILEEKFKIISLASKLLFLKTLILGVKNIAFMCYPIFKKMKIIGGGYFMLCLIHAGISSTQYNLTYPGLKQINKKILTGGLRDRLLDLRFL